MPVPATDDLTAAEAAMARGQYHLARMKFAMVLERRPQAETALFGLGKSHYLLGANENAAVHLRRYLELYPDGKFAEEARRYVSEIESIERARRAERAWQAEKMQARIAAAREAVEQRPADPQARLDLGSAYWAAAMFDRAAEQYKRAVDLDDRMRTHPVIRDRIEFGPGGKITVLTPQERERRDREANPVVVTNTRGYRAGRSAFEFQPLWYVVSGQLRNRSSKRVHGVGVEVVIFDLSGHVLDAKHIYIGTMPPGAERSFAARLTQFDDINNVYRYECNVLYR